MKPLVSVIVPVYGVEKYIERCARSLLAQTFTDMELIFVNDATPDNSMLILKKLIDENERINVRIISHEVNKGLSAARYTGLEHAVGEYILMVDSDDYIEPDMIGVLYSEATKHDADIVVCNFIYEYHHQSEVKNDYLSANPADHFMDILRKEKSFPSLCNKLIRKDLYLNPSNRNIHDMRYMEDLYVSSRLYFHAKNIIKVDMPLYHYNKMNEASITNVIRDSHFEDMLLFWSEMDKFLLKNGFSEAYGSEIAYLKIRDKIKLMFGTTSSAIRKQFATIFLQEELNTLKRYTLNERLMLFLIRHKLFLFSSLLRFVTYHKNRFLK